MIRRKRTGLLILSLMYLLMTVSVAIDIFVGFCLWFNVISGALSGLMFILYIRSFFALKRAEDIEKEGLKI